MRRRPLVPALIFAFALSSLLGCSSGGRLGNPIAPPIPPADLALEPVADGLETPVLVTSPPGDLTRLFIVGKTGDIRIVKGDSLLPTPFLSLRGQVALAFEQGLLGLAFDPLYSSNGRFYVYYTDLVGKNQLMRYRVSGNPDIAISTPDGTVLSIDHPHEFHNGGMLTFGPDGMLWLSVGDDDQPANGQTTDDLLGSLVRIDVRSGSGYSIPSDNPFNGPSAREIWNYGLRNPWRFSFDRVTGDLYMGDVGETMWEEIDVATAASGRGRAANYGWATLEGSHCNGTTGCSTAGLTMPVLDYSHGDGCSVIGGFVYRGSRIPGLRGTYFYADYCSHWVKSFHYSAGAATQQKTWAGLDPGSPITSFGEDAAGELYVCTSTGDVYRIVEPPVVAAARR